MLRIGPIGLGWRRDLPDPRDYGPHHAVAHDLLAMLETEQSDPKRTPDQVDLRPYFAQVTDQHPIHASAAHACVALVEYFDRRAQGKMTRLSPLYLHKCTEKMLGARGMTGIDLRSSLKALVRFGVPPEYQWPYDAERFGQEPDPFLHLLADGYRSITYLRLDIPNRTGGETLRTVRSFLAAGFPTVFGVPIPSSLSQESEILYRPTFDSFPMGQALVAVGYDDEHRHAGKGGLLVRSCWGQSWGDDGYGWLPYSFVEQQLAVDYWTILRRDWLSSGEFVRPDLDDAKEAFSADDVISHRPR